MRAGQECRTRVVKVGQNVNSWLATCTYISTLLLKKDEIHTCTRTSTVHICGLCVTLTTY